MVYCSKCGKENKSKNKFCENCGANLENTNNKNNNNFLDKFKSWWGNRTSNEKLISGIGLCCLGIIIIGSIGALVTPDSQPNYVYFTLNDANNTIINGYEAEIDENATHYNLSGDSEAGATIIISSSDLNLENYKIKINSTEKFTLPLNISKNQKEVKINITAQKKGKDSYSAEITIKRAEADIKPNILLEKDNVKMADGQIYVDNELVGTYEIVSKPPSVSKDVDKRLWRNTRVEIVDFRGAENDPLHYYTQYNGKWVKMAIYNNLSKMPIQITDEIYKAME